MQQKEALEIMKMGQNVYLTGEAGTGKTHALIIYIRHLRNKRIPVAVTASTGIAATHLDGVTLDSWSGLGLRDTVTDTEIRDLSHKFHLRKRIQSTKVLLIDEISMIEGQRFDAVDKILRYIRNNNLPFGGMQIILSGDLFQLPPVAKDRHKIDFIFHARAWKELKLQICYLQNVIRQTDQSLLQVLGDIRHNQVNNNTLNILSSVMQRDIISNITPTKLYTHNVDVDSINRNELEKIPGESHSYFMTTLGPDKLTLMMKRTCLAPETLGLKKGSLVMFVRNNFEKGYFNGTLGKVIEFAKSGNPVVKTSTNRKIIVDLAIWTVMEADIIVAQITQIPLRLAWAITVHKSQGMTLDAAEIDLSKSFVEGMGYVALSRVKSLNNLKLIGLNQMALRVNPEISELDKQLLDLSETASLSFKRMGWFKKWMKKREFMYQLTSW